MDNNYKTIVGTFKSLKHFSEKGMLRGQNDYNDDFYDIFSGKTCEFAVFEDGETFHVDTKIQVNHEDVYFGCDLCTGNIVKTKNFLGHVVEYLISDGFLYIETLEDNSSEEMEINFCPICGRKLEIDE
ncbi:MAG: hypothetical protein ACRCTQ_03930 [Brevinemataceae bacterium]